MNRKKMISIVVTGALVLVGIFGAVTYRVVNAQTATATPSTGTSTTNANPPAFGRGMHAFYTQQDLATALGTTLAKLQAAEQSATTEALKQAVSAGLITQAQADQFAQNNPTGQFDDNLPFLRGSTIDYNALLANALGISTDQLQTARQTAYFAAVDLAVTNGTMTQAQADLAKGNFALSNNARFQASMKTAYTAAVNQAVTDGVITQAQADQLLSNYSGFGMGGPGGPGGHGGMGGHGEPGGPGAWSGAAQGNSTTAPSSTPTTTP
jgi:hypothetical protein